MKVLAYQMFQNKIVNLYFICRQAGLSAVFRYRNLKLLTKIFVQVSFLSQKQPASCNEAKGYLWTAPKAEPGKRQLEVVWSFGTIKV